MSGRDQAAAVRLLMAARELLTDTLASDDERKRLAEQIGRFVNHEPVDEQLAERRRGARRGQVVEEADDE